MKEKIYTIPINEAFDEDCDCPLCFIEKRLEKEAVEYELGPAMMEPDHRELSNAKGYCRRHLEMMFKSPNKLPLALVLDTHLEEVRKTLKSEKPSGGLFKKNKGSKAEDIVNSCMVCEKLEKTMDRYCKVLVAMWKDEAEFREKFEKSKGFCLPHFTKLYSASSDEKFLSALLKKEEEVLSELNEDVHRFTLKFDYRNKDMEWGNAKDAPKRAVEKTVGYVDCEENGGNP